MIRAFLPTDKPTLILLDELMNYVSRNRKGGLATQLYNFLQNLSEEARGQSNVVLCVSIPASELEMSAEDHADYDRFKKLLDRLGKPVIMSAEAETSEIIRRRLFEWEPGGLPREAEKTVAEYAEWVNQHRNQIPSWFPVDQTRETFRGTYPFHPSVLSVFERKWQELPRFQQTRGVLKMLALWVSQAYSDGYRGGHRDPLIGLGTAPLDDSIFRTAVFEQIGESKLEGAVTTDICGKRESHATRLDQEAAPDIRRARLHRKVMTTIFFESNGGQSKGEATEPEVRLAVGEPDWDIGHIDTVLETWEDIRDQDLERLDAGQQEKLAENIDLSKGSIREAVWQAYNTIVVLAKDNQLRVTDMGLLHSSSAETLPGLILKHLAEAGDVEKGVSPNFLVRKWPGFVEWSTKSVRDAFFASPLFPRLLNAEAVKETIARGVSEGLLAYVGRKGHGRYEPFVFKRAIQASEVEISDDVFIVTAEEAAKHVEPQKLTSLLLFPDQIALQPGARMQFRAEGRDQHNRSMALPNATWTAAGGTVEANGAFTAGDAIGTFAVEAASGEVKGRATVSVGKQSQGGLWGGSGADGVKPTTGAGNVSGVQWTGQVPSAKWMTFYTKVLAKYAKEKGLTLRATFELRPENGLTKQQVDELRAMLRELSLDEGVETL